MQRGPIKYAKSGELRIAYQEFGEGPTNLVFIPGFISNLDLLWQTAVLGPVMRRLGEAARCATFDKRGTGLSDRELGFGSLEERIDDIRAVMDDAGIERASLFGISEGGPMALLFAATYPERVTSMVLYGTLCRALWAPDYPDGIQPEVVDALLSHVESRWGTGTALQAFVQHVPDDPEVVETLARFERSAATPRTVRQILDANTHIDVRAICSTVSVPTLVLHSSGDPMVPAAWGRWIADHVPGARYVEHDADYHVTYDGEHAWYTDEVVKFIAGDQPRPSTTTERFLATVLFTDIVDSTQRASALGDRAWRELLIWTSGDAMRHFASK